MERMRQTEGQTKLQESCNKKQETETESIERQKIDWQIGRPMHKKSHTEI